MEALSLELEQKRYYRNGTMSGESQSSVATNHQPSSPSPISSNEPTKITALNDDCFEKIFGYLDLCSLFNVAVANEWLRLAAGVVYKRKFGIKRVFINNKRSSFGHDPNYRSNPFIAGGQIYVTGLKMCLQYLRCLGSSIGNLEIRYDNWNERQCEFIHHYINKYCAGTLSILEFRNKPTLISIKHFEKPFVNVETVEVFNSDLHTQLPSFDDWFPNVRSLTLDGIHTLGSIDSPIFHRLRQLNINVNDGRCGFTIAKATDLLQQLPQLSGLNIHMPDFACPLNTLLNTMKDNPNLCNLAVTQSNRMYFWDVIPSDIQHLVNEHPVLIKLEMYSHTFAADDVLSLIRQLKSLKQATFRIISISEYTRLMGQLDNRWQSSELGYNSTVTLKR